MKTLKEIRLEYIRLVLEESGWDYVKASKVLKIPESRLHREAKSLAGLSVRREGEGVRSGGPGNKQK